MALKGGGVMIEGEAEIVASSKSPSPLYGRVGMTVKFVEIDELSRIVLTELDRARLAVKPAPPTVPPRAAQVPEAPRPVVPIPAGRVDAQNALAESVAIGDPTTLRDLGPPKAGPKFVIPSIPAGGRPKTPSSFPIVEARRPPTNAPPISEGAIPEPVPAPPPVHIPPARAKTPSVIIPKTKDTQPVAVAPPPKLDPMDRRAEKSSSLPQLEDLKVGQTQAVAVVPPPKDMFVAKNLFDDSVTGDTATTQDSRGGPLRHPDDSADLRPIEPPRPPRAATPPVSPTTATHVAVVPAPPVSPTTATHLAITPAPDVGSDTEDALAPAPPPRDAPPPTPALTQTATHTAPPPVLATATTPMATPVPPELTLDESLPFDTLPPEMMAGRGAAVPKPPVEPEPMTLAALVKAAAANKQARSADANPTIRGTAAPAKAPSPPIVGKPAPPSIELANDEPTDLTEIPTTRDTEAMEVEVGDDDNKATRPRPVVAGGPRIEEPTPSGDWTMTPDGPVETKSRAPTPPPVRGGNAAASDEDGDWTITPDMPAPDGYDKPRPAGEVPPVPVAPKPVPRASAAAQAEPRGDVKKRGLKTRAFQAIDLAPKSAGDDEPKVQIDPTLMEPLKPMPVFDEPDPLVDPAAPVRAVTPAPAVDSGRIATPFAREPSAPSAPALPPQLAPPPPMMMPPAPPPLMVAPPPPPIGIPTPLPMMGNSPGLPTPMPMQAFAPEPTGMGMAMSPFPAQHQHMHTPTPFAPPPTMANATGSTPVFPGDHAGASTSVPPNDGTSVLEIGRRRRLMVIVLTALAAVVIGIVVVVVILKTGGSSPTTKPTTSTPATKSGAGPDASDKAGSAAIGDPQPATGGSAEATGSDGSADGSDVAKVATGSDGSGDATPAVGSGSGSATKTATVPVGDVICTVDVVSVPAGAEIFSDKGKSLGTAPRSLELPCGKPTKLELRKSGHVNQTRNPTATQAGTKLRVVLPRPVVMTSIKVSSTPTQATITVGGKSMGNTPSMVKLPAGEPVTIVLSKDGYASESEKITPKPGASVHLTLKKKRAR